MDLQDGEFPYKLEDQQPMDWERASRRRITIDIGVELCESIQIAANEQDLSVDRYVEGILSGEIPARHFWKPISQESLDRLKEIRERLYRENNYQFFEDSVEVIREMREERVRQLTGEE